jgi:hypothetical protein
MYISLATHGERACIYIYIYIYIYMYMYVYICIYEETLASGEGKAEAESRKLHVAPNCEEEGKVEGGRKQGSKVEEASKVQAVLTQNPKGRVKRIRPITANHCVLPNTTSLPLPPLQPSTTIKLLPTTNPHYHHRCQLRRPALPHLAKAATAKKFTVPEIKLTRDVKCMHGTVRAVAGSLHTSPTTSSPGKYICEFGFGVH